MTDSKENLKLVFKAEDQFEAEVIKARLAENGIEALLFSRTDSMFTVLDDTRYSAGVLVDTEDEAKALEIIKTKKENRFWGKR